MKKKKVMLLLALSSACMLAACGRNATSSSSTETAVEEKAEASDEAEDETAETNAEEIVLTAKDNVVVTYDEAIADADAYAEIFDAETGKFLVEADGFVAGGETVYFSDFSTYDKLCVTLSNLNGVCELDTSSLSLLDNSLGNAPEDFSAEMEEQIRTLGSDSVSFSFSVEGVENAINVQVSLSSDYDMNSLSVVLAGNGAYTENGIMMVFLDYGVNIVNGGADYEYIFGTKG